ncbi:MAG: glycosyltransferase family 9 protein [Rickettsiales bacterium]|jgi:ADP-heptose:LPS heptosyltransferase|nr:glycosyltransferase family 9 protein [Rickettsiales bacterium]
MSDDEVILVIKHGALGDIVLATGPFAAIRAQHTHAHIVVLTIKTYTAMLQQSPYFDEVWIDEKPKLWQLAGMRRLKRQLNQRVFQRVYDLQTSQRSTSYFRLFQRKPLWSGLVTGEWCHDTPHRTQLHTLDREREQMAIAGISSVGAPDVQWLRSDVSRFGLSQPYALLVAGGSAHRPQKRWPANHYAALCLKLLDHHIQPVLIGAGAEAEVLQSIAAADAKRIINLCNRTDFADIASLARQARVIIGNDTGPMHLAAATQSPCLVLFSDASNPDLCAPRGDNVRIIQRPILSNLQVNDVFSVIEPWLHLDSAA